MPSSRPPFNALASTTRPGEESPARGPGGNPVVSTAVVIVDARAGLLGLEYVGQVAWLPPVVTLIRGRHYIDVLVAHRIHEVQHAARIDHL